MEPVPGSATVRQVARPGERLHGSVVPALVGLRSYATHELHLLPGAGGEEVGHAVRAPRLLQQRMLDRAVAAGPLLRRIDDAEWLGILTRAGEQLAAAAGEERSGLATRAAATSGIPVTRVVRAWETLAAELGRMEEILAVQSPDGTAEPYRTGRVRGQRWRWTPAGRHAAVRIPPSFPTIGILWLQALAARRPVLLCAPLQDPFTSFVLAGALYRAGVPDGAISLCYDDAPLFWTRADQVLWPGELREGLCGEPGRVRRFHQGRSKALVLGRERPAALFARLAQRVAQGCGRLCTNVSALLVEEDVGDAAAELAAELACLPVLPLDHPQAMVPAFPDRDLALAVAARVWAAVSRGATDVTAEATGLPLVCEHDGRLFLRPTVLLVPADDPILGTELPFPFVTVAKVARPRMAERCRGSLVVWVVGDEGDLAESLLLDPSIDKVFAGDLDRDYDPADPHEGYVSDFLFRKKAFHRFQDPGAGTHRGAHARPLPEA